MREVCVSEREREKERERKRLRCARDNSFICKRDR
jgi:hypothetical protein